MGSSIASIDRMKNYLCKAGRRRCSNLRAKRFWRASRSVVINGHGSILRKGATTEMLMLNSSRKNYWARSQLRLDRPTKDRFRFSNLALNIEFDFLGPESTTGFRKETFLRRSSLLPIDCSHSCSQGRRISD